MAQKVNGGRTKLKKLEEWYRPLFENVNDAVIVCGEQGNILGCNEIALKRLGYHRGELLKLCVLDIIHPNLRPMMEEDHRRAWAGETVIAKFIYLTKDGTSLPGEVRTRRIEHAGEPAVLVVMRNITSRREAEEALRQSEQSLKAILESSNDVIFQLSSAGFIQYVTPDIKDYGYERHKLIGKHFKGVAPRRDAPKVLKVLNRVLSGEAVRGVEIGLLDSRGKATPMELNAAPIKKDGKIIAVQGIMRDVTTHKRADGERMKMAKRQRQKAEELKHAYAELEESKDELVRTEKLAHAGRIAASIAHEIRNPLTNVVMSIQQIKKVLKPGHPKSGHIHIIESNVDRINYLITELLNCARPPKLEMQPHDVHKVLDDVLKSTSGKVRSGRIKVIKKFTPKPPKVNIDREQMGRVFSNLIINAAEAMYKKRGRLTIVTEAVNSSIVVKFQDNGKGIPEKDVIRIFDPFFSTKSGGVGLGLTLCYGIIVGHGGSVEVKSSWRKGTVFTVTLPIRGGRVTCPR